MKRLSLIVLLTTLLLACSREEAETPLYQRFAARTDLTAAQVIGFQLNDSVKTDVIILVADDTTAWNRLKTEFDIRSSEGVTSWMGNIDNPDQRARSRQWPAWRTMAVHAERTIAFYRVDSDEQYEALLDYQLKKLTNEK